MTYEEDIKTLHQHESFARFVETIYTLREETISTLHNADTEKMQQISGMILCYDQILQMTDWNGLQLRHMERLKGHL